MRKKINKWASVFLAAVLLTGTVLPGNAAEPGNKEENVYARLAYDGSVDHVYVVNTLEFAEQTEFLDYGNYESVKNLSGNALLSSGKGEVTGIAPAGSFYYQGELRNAQLPWEISIQYHLDGVEVTAPELAGQTGKLELCLQVEENTGAEKAFREQFQLQILIPMQMQKCSSLQAPGASVTNSGTKKQLVYTVLPGQEKKIRMTADVQNFEMEPIQFQGVPAALDMNSELLSLDDLREKTQDLSEKADGFKEDALEIQGSTDSLISGVDGISRSAGVLKEGIADYTDGTKMVKDGMEQLCDGNLELLDGGSQLTDGMVTLRDGVNTLNAGFGGENGLISGSRQLADGIKTLDERAQELADGINEMLDMQEQFEEISTAALDAEAEVIIQRTMLELQIMNLEIPDLSGSKEEQLKQLSEHLKKLIVQVALGDTVSENTSEGNADGDHLERLLELKSDVDQMLGNYETQREVETLLNSEETKSEIEELKQGMDEFQSGVDQLADGSKKLADGIGEVGEGVAKLADGTGELVDGGYELVDGIRQFGDGILDLSDGAEELKNAAEGLWDGADQLAGSSDEILEGIQDVAETAQQLKTDTDLFQADTEDMDGNLDEELDKAMREFAVEAYQPTSFVSEKNKNVRLVQFLMKTPEIQIAKVPEPVTVAENTGFWMRLIRLFGFGK